jgi:hypothetical protein
VYPLVNEQWVVDQKGCHPEACRIPDTDVTPDGVKQRCCAVASALSDVFNLVY